MRNSLTKLKSAQLQIASVHACSQSIILFSIPFFTNRVLICFFPRFVGFEAELRLTYSVDSPIMLRLVIDVSEQQSSHTVS